MKVCPACKIDYRGGEVFCPVDATRLVSTSTQIRIPVTNPEGDPLIGTVLAGRYLVERRIGEGGMGLVYAGMHRDIGKRVAIKVLRDELSRRPEVVARFRQEARSASRIGHEHIVDIFDFGETVRGSSYFIMEFLEGQDLANVLGREVTVEPARACSIALQCCRALEAAHAKGIVHRDIKPENIFLIKRDGLDDFVKIVDFGIAKMSDIETDGAPGRKLTKTGMIFGTPEYMSPEQAAGKDLDHRVDIYALGIILYECLAGRVPFQGDTFMGVLTQHLFAELPPLLEVNPEAQVSPELELVIRKSLAKSPEDRYQDTEELAEALSCALEGRLSPATALALPPDIAPQSSEDVHALPRTKSSRWLWVAGLAAALATLGWVGYGQSAGQQSDGETSQAVEAPDLATVREPAQARAEVAGVDPGVVAEDRHKEETTSSVRLHVASDPPGARLLLADGTEACATTPCTIEATTGSLLVLRAKLGKRRGRVALTPTREDNVLIELAAPHRSRGRPKDVQASKRADPAPVRASDLKVPEWAR
jgi:serine/threonine protein kinase